MLRYIMMENILMIFRYHSIIEWINISKVPFWFWKMIIVITFDKGLVSTINKRQEKDKNDASVQWIYEQFLDLVLLSCDANISRALYFMNTERRWFVCINFCVWYYCWRSEKEEESFKCQQLLLELCSNKGEPLKNHNSFTQYFFLLLQVMCNSKIPFIVNENSFHDYVWSNTY